MNKSILSIIGAIIVIGTFIYNVLGTPPDTELFKIISAFLYSGGTYLITRRLYPPNPLK